MTSPREPRLIRTLVFVGGHDLDRIRRLFESRPDAICIDLEDSTPVDRKDEARAQFRQIAAEITEAGSLVFARTNGPDGGMLDDLDAVVGDHLHCVSLPKVERGAQVVDFAQLVDDAERRHQQDAGSVLVRPVIETPLGVLNAYEIAASSSRVAYLGGVEGGIFGDLGGALGYVQTDDGRETAYLRSKVLIDARAALVPFPIGGGMTAKNDAPTARAFARENRILGYSGVHCAAHNEVISAVNDELSPDMADIEAWLGLMPEFEVAEQAGLTVAHIDGKIYDLVGLVRVREQIDLARRIGMLGAAPTGDAR